MNKQIEDDDFNEEELFSQEAIAPKFSPQKKTGNPLASYFRSPGLNITLPTRGKFLPPELFDETLAGDIEIFPMTAADELMLKNPDALMSGTAIENLIRSCVPSIKTPRLISTPDLDVILIAIRAATYGQNMEIENVCPKCGKEHTMNCNLGGLIANMTFVPDDNSVRLNDDLVAIIKPMDMQTAVKISMATFNQTKKIQALEYMEDVTDELRQHTRNEVFNALTKINESAIADCVVYIDSPNGRVFQRDHLVEFLKNSPSPIIKKIDEKVKEFNEYGVNKQLKLTCSKCEHEWESTLEFNPASFFE